MHDYRIKVHGVGNGFVSDLRENLFISKQHASLF